MTIETIPEPRSSAASPFGRMGKPVRLKLSPANALRQLADFIERHEVPCTAIVAAEVHACFRDRSDMTLHLDPAEFRRVAGDHEIDETDALDGSPRRHMYCTSDGIRLVATEPIEEVVGHA